MITLKELAERCGVSIATISNILNGKTNVSDATKERVLKIIEETGYKPNYIAHSLRANKTKNIGLIIDDITAFSSPHIIEGILSSLEPKGYKAIVETMRLYNVFNNQPNTDEYARRVQAAIKEMISIRVDGIIFVAAHKYIVDFIPDNLEIPLVVTYAQVNNSLASVDMDEEESACKIVKYVIGKGHKNIGVISGSKENLEQEERYKGYKRALAESNLPLKNEYIVHGAWNRQSGYDGARFLLENNKEISAIFCFNDMMASGVYDYLKEKDLTPGKDISVAGFDNQEIAAVLNPPLTTMAIPLWDIGINAAKLVLDKINKVENTPQKISIPCELIERESVL